MRGQPLKNYDTSKIQTWVFGGILAGLFLLVCRLFTPFATILLWSVLLFIIVEPLHYRIAHRLDVRTKRGRALRSVTAALFAVGTMVVVLVPLGFVCSRAYLQLLDVFDSIKEHIQLDIGTSGRSIVFVFCEQISMLIKTITAGELFFEPEELYARVVNLIEANVYSVVNYSGAILRGVGMFIVSAALIVFCLFFYFLDGIYLAHLIKRVVPIKQIYITTIIDKFKEITRNLVFGYLIVALIQALIVFVIFVIFKVKGALLFACLSFICVFIPVIGAALVWLPLGLVQMAAGAAVQGIVFMLLCFLCTSMLDNILRPFFLQNRLQLHPLVIFFSILGGIALFKFNGFILGPMIVVLFLTVLELFFKEHNIHYEDEETVEGTHESN